MPYNKVVKAVAAFIFVLFIAAAGTALYARIGVLVPQTAAVVSVQPMVPAPAPPPEVHILAFGDLMLDRHVRQKIDTNGGDYLFENIKKLFAGQDIIVANAEGVFTDNDSTASYDNLVFTFSTTTLPLLKQLGFTFFSQANNHALNFGWKGLTESKNNIVAAGMDSFGDPDNVNPGPLVTQVNGIKVAFVGYDQFSAKNGDDTSALAAIATAKAQGAFVIVYPHWGIEYQSTTTEFQRTEAHRFVDAGADAILGGHPHVVEPIEIYNGKAIFYSMGNFIFDQPWDDTREGLGIGLSLTDTSVTYTLQPFEIQLMQPTPLQNAFRSIYLLGLSETASTTDQSLRPAIATGSFVLQR